MLLLLVSKPVEFGELLVCAFKLICYQLRNKIALDLSWLISPQELEL